MPVRTDGNGPRRSLKVVCTCLPGYGHFHPILSLATALARRGHEVVFATAAEFCPRIEEMGFATFPAGISLAEQLERAAASIPEAAMPPGKERFVSFVPKMLAGVAAPPRAADLLAFLRDWEPDLLLHEETELGGPLAAAAAGIPWAGQSVGIMRPLAMARLAGQTIEPLASEWGVDVGPYAGLFRYIYLDVCPPSLQSGEIAQVGVAHPMQNVHFPGEGPAGANGPAAPVGGTGAGHPAWIDELDDDRPTVYISLGTIFNQDPTVFSTILDGLHAEPLNIIVTLGPGADPGALGPQPDHVHVEAFIPQSLILPRCDVVVNQGGTAILSILGQGLPILVLPQGANQFHNAEACVSGGVGRSLLPGEVDPASVRREVRLLLDDPAYAARSSAIAAEIRAMPGPEEGAALVERLAVERAPLMEAAS